jgi:predicted dinucleotide-binding enzyme
MQMRITTIGRGRMGGGLARLWENAGHRVTRLGSDGGDVSDAEVVLVAVPGHSIAEALGRVTGFSGQVTLDATSIRADQKGNRDGAFPSLAHQIKSIIGGPTAKAFSSVHAAIFDEIAAQRVKPSNLFAADAEARVTAENLIIDAGFDPVFVGDLDSGARLIEDHAPLVRAIAVELGPSFYRIARPGDL